MILYIEWILKTPELNQVNRMKNNIKELRELGAAHQAALEYDYCPKPSVGAKLVGEIETNFTESEFRLGCGAHKGMSASEIANIIINKISKL